MSVKLSLVIPARNADDPKLKELLRSIEAQDFPKDEMETLVITEGTSESAKAIGIRRAKGEVIGILASDNELMQSNFLTVLTSWAKQEGAAYPVQYFPAGDALNRYFALIGGNDPLAFYMMKNDRYSYLKGAGASLRGSIGDNGFFIRKELIEKTDLDNYYHVDNAIEATKVTEILPCSGFPILHKTGGNIFKFFAKRYRYGLQHAFNKNRRWHLVDFKQSKDIRRLIWFIFVSLTVLEPLSLSIRGYSKIKDMAWFLHWPICLMTLFTYVALVIHLCIHRSFQSLFAPMGGQKA